MMRGTVRSGTSKLRHGVLLLPLLICVLSFHPLSGALRTMSMSPDYVAFVASLPSNELASLCGACGMNRTCDVALHDQGAAEEDQAEESWRVCAVDSLLNAHASSHTLLSEVEAAMRRLVTSQPLPVARRLDAQDRMFVEGLEKGEVQAICRAMGGGCEGMGEEEARRVVVMAEGEEAGLVERVIDEIRYGISGMDTGGGEKWWLWPRQGSEGGKRSLSQCASRARDIVGVGGDPRYAECCSAMFPPRDLAFPVASAEDMVSGAKVGRRRTVYEALVNHETRAVYLRVYKSASSMISNLLLSEGFSEMEFQGKLRGEQSQLLEGYCTFTFVREPWERFISGYYTSNANRGLASTERDSCFSYEQRIGEPARFTQFVRDMHTSGHAFMEPIALEGKHPRCAKRAEHHVSSQIDILNAVEGLSFDFVGRVSHLAEDWRRLQEVVCPGHALPTLDPRWGKINVARGQEFECGMAGHEAAALCPSNVTMGAGEEEGGMRWCTQPACEALKGGAEAAKGVMAYLWQDMVCLGFEPPEGLAEGLAEWAAWKSGLGAKPAPVVFASKGDLI